MSVIAIFVSLLVSAAALAANGIVRLFVHGGTAIVTVGAYIGEVSLALTVVVALAAIAFRIKRHFFLGAATMLLQFASAGLALMYSTDGGNGSDIESYRLWSWAISAIAAISIARIALGNTWSIWKFLKDAVGIFLTTCVPPGFALLAMLHLPKMMQVTVALLIVAATLIVMQRLVPRKAATPS